MEQVLLRVLLFCHVSLIPPMLGTHLQLLVARTKTNGRSLGTCQKKQRFFRKKKKIIGKKMPLIAGSSGCWSPDSQRGGLGSMPGQFMRDMWRTKWLCDRFVSQYFGLSLSVSFWQCSIPIVMWILLLGLADEAWKPSKQSNPRSDIEENWIYKIGFMLFTGCSSVCRRNILQSAKPVSMFFFFPPL